MSKLQLIWLLALGTVNTGLAFDESKGQEDTSGALYIEMGDPEDHSESDSSSGSAGWHNKLYKWSALAWHYTISREAPYYEKIRHFLLTHPKISRSCDSIGQTAASAILFQNFITLDIKRWRGEETSPATDTLIDNLYEVASFTYDNAAKSVNRNLHSITPKLNRTNRIILLAMLYPLVSYFDLHILIRQLNLNIGLTHIVGLMAAREIMDGWTELSREETVHGETINDLEAQITAEIARRNSEFEEDDQC